MSKDLAAKEVDEGIAHYFDSSGALINPKHELFAQAYVHVFNQQKAAEMVGIQPNPAGEFRDIAFAIARRPEVRKRVAMLRDERVKSIGLDENWVVLNLIDVYEEGRKQIKVLDKEGRDTGETVMADGKVANRSLELLGNYLAMFRRQDDRTAGAVIVNVDYGGGNVKVLEKAPLDGEVV